MEVGARQVQGGPPLLGRRVAGSSDGRCPPFLPGVKVAARLFGTSAAGCRGWRGDGSWGPAGSGWPVALEPARCRLKRRQRASLPAGGKSCCRVVRHGCRRAVSLFVAAPEKLWALCLQDVVDLGLHALGQGLWLVGLDEGDGLFPQPVAQLLAAAGDPIFGPLAAEQRWLPQVAKVL